MTLVQGYTHSVLIPQLRSLGLSKRQWEIVVEDVRLRLESLLSHWNDVPFRRTILLLGNEEASFWRPQSAGNEIRSLVVVAVRNSLIEDLGASHSYIKILRSTRIFLPDERMPWITIEAVKHFQAVELDGLQVQPTRDVFGDLPHRFPNAWNVLASLGSSSESEIECRLPLVKEETRGSSTSTRDVQQHSVVVSGIDPTFDDELVSVLKQIEQGEADLFFSPSFKGITRNPEKLLSIIDHVLKYGGRVLTPNYFLSSTYLARRNPLLRPAHYVSEIGAQIANSEGLTKRHKDSLASLVLP